MTTISPVLDEKMQHLRVMLKEMEKVIVAFSGGVDSTFLLRLAQDTLGLGHVLAVIGDSPSYPAREFEEAKKLAALIGAPYQVVKTDELKDAHYAANPSNRCYYCKNDLFSRLVVIAREQGFLVVLDGNNADDRGDWRPGQQAGRELGVRSPLQEAAMTKAEIREASKAMGLPTWDKPSFACLSSRIPYGSPITRENLSIIEAAENFLRDEGFTQLRVRHHGDLARIEVPAGDISRLLEPHLRERISARLRELGYHYVTADLLGYRTGSMNEVL
jgi:pyridinium-3,5-biscarboxylic acid mononucleotide sulfurtransferase